MFQVRKRFSTVDGGSRFVNLLAIIALAIVVLLPVLFLSACGGASVTSRATKAAVSTHTGPLIYVALGASDGVGVGTSDPARDNWPTVLSGELGQPVHLDNLSMTGETVADALKSELPLVVKVQPNVVTVWLAVDDFVAGVSLATYTDQLTTLLHTLHLQTPARVYVGNIPDLALLPAASGVNTAALIKVIAQWNATIAKIAAAQGATLVDLYSGAPELARNPEYISSDGFHPSTAGAERIAQFFAGIIRPSLARQPAA